MNEAKDKGAMTEGMLNEPVECVWVYDKEKMTVYATGLFESITTVSGAIATPASYAGITMEIHKGVTVTYSRLHRAG